MAAAFLRAGAYRRHRDLQVGSAGFVSEGTPPPLEVVDVMAAVGIDVSGHRSRLLTTELLDDADLVVTMSRQHLIDLAVAWPSAWNRSFTFAELLRRAEAVGAAAAGDGPVAWVARVNSGRVRSETLSLTLADDVVDPMGGRLKDYERVRDQLSVMVDRLAGFLPPA
jgi:protein-tyrosine phosphatase